MYAHHKFVKSQLRKSHPGNPDPIPQPGLGGKLGKESLGARRLAGLGVTKRAIALFVKTNL